MPDDEKLRHDLADAYKTYVPLFFGALASCARRGLSVQTDDALDLIHDFFSEEWEGLERRFDPSRARFSTYAYGAFLRFAESRIRRLQRWQAQLVDPAELGRLMARPREVGVGQWQILSAKDIETALSGLPDIERLAVESFLQYEGQTERGLAAEFGVSRYRYREILSEALGRLLVHLGERGRIPKQEWGVALALWQRGRTIPQAAAELSTTSAEVRRVRAHLLQFLTHGIRQCQPPRRRRTGDAAMVHSDLDQVLRKAVLTGEKRLFDELRQRAEEVRELLLQREFVITVDEEMRHAIEGHSERLEELYKALGTQEELFEEESADLREVQQIQTMEHESIGNAFRKGLLTGLPPSLVNLESWFGKLPERSDLAEALREEPDVQAGGEEALYLASRGLRPLGAFYATEAIALLFDRFQQERWLLPDLPILLDMKHNVQLLTRQKREQYFPHAPPVPGGVEFPEAIAPNLLFEEVAAMAECPLKSAPFLLYWLIQVARLKPYVFGRFVASPKESGVALMRSWVADDDLLKRWSICTKSSLELLAVH